MGDFEELTPQQKSLIALRVACYGAMQHLKGQDLKAFWELIDELTECRDAFVPEDGG